MQHQHQTIMCLATAETSAETTETAESAEVIIEEQAVRKGEDEQHPAATAAPSQQI